MILLPEHLHTIWKLPRDDDDYPTRWRRIKEEFTESWLAAGGTEAPITTSRRKRKERGVWQRRYWEHLIDDEYDFDRHFDYIHYNAVKHGEANCPKDWSYSSFHRWAKKGVYQPDWGCDQRGPLKFDDLDETAMEFHVSDNWTFAKCRIKTNFIDVSPYFSLKIRAELALQCQIAKVQ